MKPAQNRSYMRRLNPNAIEFHPNNSYYHPSNFTTSSNFLPLPPPPTIELPHTHFQQHYQQPPYYFNPHDHHGDHHHPHAASMMGMNITTHSNHLHHLYPHDNYPGNPKKAPRLPQLHPPRRPKGRWVAVKEVATGSGQSARRMKKGELGDHYGEKRGQNGKSTDGSRGIESRVWNKKWGREKKEVIPVRPDGSETTVMIRNIPNQYTRNMLIKFLDDYCEAENQKLSKGATYSVVNESQANGHPQFAYDFLYLPIDFRSEANKGFAFVNFTHPMAVWRFYLACDGKSWKHCSSIKICRIAYATIQGKENLTEHFGKSKFICDKDEFLPVCFSPPRDGSGISVIQTAIGERIPPPPPSRSHN